MNGSSGLAPAWGKDGDRSTCGPILHDGLQTGTPAPLHPFLLLAVGFLFNSMLNEFSVLL